MTWREAFRLGWKRATLRINVERAGGTIEDGKLAADLLHPLRPQDRPDVVVYVEDEDEGRT